MISETIGIIGFLCISTLFGTIAIWNMNFGTKDLDRDMKYDAPIQAPSQKVKMVIPEKLTPPSFAEEFKDFTGPLPLTNDRNLCYMNSLSHCLAAVYAKYPVFRYCSIDWNPVWNDYLKVLAKISRREPSTEEPLSPRKFYEPFAKMDSKNFRNFFNFQQQDPTEVLQTLLDVIDISPLAKMLKCSNFEIKTCTKCGYTSFRVVKDSILALALDTSTNNIAGLMSIYTKKQEVELNCSRSDCYGKMAYKNINFYDAQVLVIALKIYNYLGEKITDLFNISEYMEHPLTKSKYRVLGVIYHSGVSVNSGHYISVVRYGDKYFKCDDTAVNKVVPIEYSAVEAGECDSCQAYMIFYEKL